MKRRIKRAKNDAVATGVSEQIKPNSLEHLWPRFAGKWVCLDEHSRVCGASKFLEVALKQANDRFYKMPTLFFVAKS